MKSTLAEVANGQETTWVTARRERSKQNKRVSDGSTEHSLLREVANGLERTSAGSGPRKGTALCIDQGVLFTLFSMDMKSIGFEGNENEAYQRDLDWHWAKC